ncbi:MAG: hypothetical protein M3019_07660 [Candidatus Dormibacteraeota bacterium]|nr:hypothetical protein [Candidatus Dormibacteraeota bacterium]
MSVLGHIVGGGLVWPLWVTGSLLFGGAVGAMAVAQTLRRACLAIAAIGLISTVIVYTLLPSAPIAPRGLTVRIVAPKASATVTSPVLVRVCGDTSNLPGAGRLLSISVDGRQVAEVDADSAAVALAAGTYTLRAALVTTKHLEYAPPVLTDETITITGVGALAPAPDCVGGR